MTTIRPVLGRIAAFQIAIYVPIVALTVAFSPTIALDTASFQQTAIDGAIYLGFVVVLQWLASTATALAVVQIVRSRETIAATVAVVARSYGRGLFANAPTHLAFAGGTAAIYGYAVVMTAVITERIGAPVFVAASGGIAMLVALVIGLYVALRTGLAPIFVVADGVGVAGALRRSRESMRGRYASAFLLLILVTAVAVVMATVLAMATPWSVDVVREVTWMVVGAYAWTCWLCFADPC